MSDCKIYVDTEEEGSANDEIYYEKSYPTYLKPTSYIKQILDFDTCLQENLPETWEIDCEQLDDEIDTKFMFCVPTDYSVKIFNHETQKIEEVEVKIKFALEFELKYRTKAVFEECEELVGYGSDYDLYKCVNNIECQPNLIGPPLSIFELTTPTSKPPFWSAEQANAVCDLGKVCCEYHYYSFS